MQPCIVVCRTSLDHSENALLKSWTKESIQVVLGVSDPLSKRSHSSAIVNGSIQGRSPLYSFAPYLDDGVISLFSFELNVGEYAKKVR